MSQAHSPKACPLRACARAAHYAPLVMLPPRGRSIRQFRRPRQQGFPSPLGAWDTGLKAGPDAVRCVRARQRQTECCAALKFIRVALPNSVANPPGGQGWLHEPNLDGYLIRIVKDGPAVRLYSQDGRDWTKRLARGG